MFNYAHMSNSNNNLVIIPTKNDVGNTLNSSYDLNPIFTQRLQNTDLMVPFVTNSEGTNLALISVDPLDQNNLNIINSMLDSLAEAHLDSLMFTFIGFNDEILEFTNIPSYSNILILVIDKKPVYFYVFDDATDVSYDEFKTTVRLIKETVFE